MLGNMELEQILNVANAAVFQRIGRYLTDVEQVVLRGAFADQTYEQIADQSGYSISYVKRDVGPKLWRLLSEVLGEEVSKSNFRGALQRHQVEQERPVNEAVTAWSSATRNTPSSTSTRVVPRDNLEREVSTAQQTALIPEGYVKRPPIEEHCIEMLRSPGSLVRVKAPTLIGKTSLINWVMAELASHGFQIVSLSLKLAERNIHFADLDKFLRWFCISLSRELRIPSQLETFWDEETLGAKMSCSTYLEDYVLAQAEGPLVLCLDDVDLLFPYPAIYEDFFGLLRSWHEKGKTRPLWKKLRMALVYSTDVYIPLKINHSPFNVGVLVELPEFNPHQVQEFALKLGVDPQDSIIQPLIQLVGGHPYLLEQAFSCLRAKPDLDFAELIKTASTDAGIYRNHLRHLWLSFQGRPDLAIAFNQVVNATEPIQISPLLAYQLQSLGLVEFVGNAVTTRSLLYRRYFAEHSQALALGASLRTIL